MQQENEKNIRIFVSPCQFGTWVKEKRASQHLSLREFAKKVENTPGSTVSVSPSYLSRLERGYDALISPEILYGIKEALGLSNQEILENLSERNYARFSNFLRVQKRQLLDQQCGVDKDEEWREFLQRAHELSGKILKPLLTDLIDREILSKDMLPFYWAEDFWRGDAHVEDMAETMTLLAQVYELLEANCDNIAIATRSAIENALSSEYLKSRRLLSKHKHPH